MTWPDYLIFHHPSESLGMVPFIQCYWTPVHSKELRNRRYKRTRCYIKDVFSEFLPWIWVGRVERGNFVLIPGEPTLRRLNPSIYLFSFFPSLSQNRENDFLSLKMNSEGPLLIQGRSTLAVDFLHVPWQIFLIWAKIKDEFKLRTFRTLIDFSSLFGRILEIRNLPRMTQYCEVNRVTVTSAQLSCIDSIF